MRVTPGGATSRNATSCFRLCYHTNGEILCVMSVSWPVQSSVADGNRKPSKTKTIIDARHSEAYNLLAFFAIGTSVPVKHSVFDLHVQSTTFRSVHFQSSQY